MLMKIVALYNFFHANAALILGVLWGISESLAKIPAVKANSVFEAIENGLAYIKAKFVPQVDEQK